MAEPTGTAAFASGRGIVLRRDRPVDRDETVYTLVIRHSAMARASTAATDPVLVPAGLKGPGGWSCHTFEDGQTFPAICLADDCPDREQRESDRFEGQVLA